MAARSLGRIGTYVKTSVRHFGHWLIDDDAPTYDPVADWLNSRSKEKADARPRDRVAAVEASLELIERRERGQVADADFERERAEIQAMMPPPKESAAGFVAAYGTLALLLLGAYLGYVALAGWVVLTVLSITVSTGVWIVTVVGAAVLGIVVFYGIAGLGKFERLNRVAAAAPVVVPVVIEAVVFGLVGSA